MTLTEPVRGAKATRSPDELDRAFRFLDRWLPAPLDRWLDVLRKPEWIWLRIPLGLLLIAASFFWFLPVVGLENLPMGLLLIAEDVPFLRKPIGTLVLWLELAFVRLLRRWRNRRRRLVKVAPMAPRGVIEPDPGFAHCSRKRSPSA